MAAATKSNVLPKIMEILSRKKDLSANIDDLCEELEEYVATENPNKKIGEIRKAIRKALDIGQNLGIISLANNTIRMPFSLRANGQTMDATDANLEEDETISDENIDTYDDNAPRTRRKSQSPRKMTLRDADLQYVITQKRNDIGYIVSPTDRVGRRRSPRSHRQRRGRITRRGRVSRRRVSRRRR